MFHKSFPLLIIGLWGIVVLPFSNRASATTPLTRAEIQNLRNLVQLIPKNNLNKRPARKLDAMIPGDGLSTGRASLVDLRFNDGSLARIGEQAVFQFLPKTRDFRLTNGTVLLLIPPGRGQTRIQTPSAAAAIRGSALFMRYNQKTDTTIVGALTNSGIKVFNKEASQTQVLEAGQMMVIVKGKFQSLYDFDLRNFYETSELVRELDLNRQNPTPTADFALTSVQNETAAALKAQPPITGEGVIENPSFMQLTPSPSNSPIKDVTTNNSSANSLEKTGQASTNTEMQDVTTNTSNVNTQENNVGVDSSRTLTTPQNSSAENLTNQNPPNNTSRVKNPTDNTPVEKPTDSTPPMEKPTDSTPPMEKPTDSTPPMEKPTDSTPPMEKPTDSTLPMEKPIDSTLPMEKPIDSTLPMEKPIDSTLPMEKPIDSTLPMEKPIDITPPVENPIDITPPVENPIDSPNP
ncbi:FecR family protein [aff. Roholtiella sp. LEGE 12411]|uniref:FecR family protein n=1 Tax=aff. Roholtiella sp. LEGE 12411 TaxID=1828822 RepID=UPI0018829CC6|nr:FecR family protein [aff. Roholtiella sp. LEGE 12411]MBE9037289.1 FecR domain-containing protein [aff. Roholtiella sp. LEGE 12411]